MHKTVNSTQKFKGLCGISGVPRKYAEMAFEARLPPTLFLSGICPFHTIPHCALIVGTTFLQNNSPWNFYDKHCPSCGCLDIGVS